MARKKKEKKNPAKRGLAYYLCCGCARGEQSDYETEKYPDKRPLERPTNPPYEDSYRRYLSFSLLELPTKTWLQNIA